MSIVLEYLKDHDWESLRARLDLLAGYVRAPMPNARVYNSVAIPILDNTPTILTFNSERWDVGNLHSTSVNTSRLTASITGLYLIGTHVEWAATPNGTRSLGIRFGGTTLIASDDDDTNTFNSKTASVTTLYQLKAGEYVESRVYQNSGSTVNVVSSGNDSPEFWMVRLGGFANEGVA